MQKISGDCCPCLFVCLYQLSVALRGWGENLEIGKPSIVVITLLLMMDKVEHNSSVLLHWLLNITLSTWQMWGITAMWVWPLYSCQLLYPSYPLSNSTHVHSTYCTHFEQTFTNASQLLTFNQKCYHCLFELHINLSCSRINCGPAILWAKELNLM